MSRCAFGVLGPLQIAGRAPELPRQAQVLLGVLVLRANEIVSPLRLSDEIWGEQPPASGANAVQVYVSRLRKTIEAAGVEAAITRHPGGYVLEVDSSSVDWLLYTSIIGEATRARATDPGRAAALLCEALALWRGPALAGLTFESVTATEIGQLEESRLATIERRLDHDLELGRHLELVAELQGLIAEHPFRESLRTKLVLALYRAGRQADALDECRRATQFLRDELGLEPSPALRRLEQAVLVQDPALAPAPPAAPAATPARAEGRRRPVAAVWLSLDDAALADRDPELAESAIARWTDELTGCLERHGASILPGLPGELVAIFGLARAREDDALRASRAALDARAAHEAVGARAATTLTLRGAVEVGEIVEGGGSEPGITGAVVGRVRRLAGQAGPGEILLGDGALALVREGVETAGERALTAVRRTAEAIPRQLTRPLVGRRAELDAVQRHVVGCFDWELPGLTVLVGPAGIGKSRVAAEVVRHVGDQALTLRARCLPDEQGVAFAPLHDVVTGLLSEHGRDGLEEIAAAADDPGATTARFLALAGAAEIASTREETFLAVRRVLEGLATKQPLVLLVEDLHWAESAFIDLLLHVAGAAAGPIAIVATSRPDVLERRHELAAEHPRCSAVMIGPLAQRDCDELFAVLPGGGSLSSETKARIVEASGGNPLFIEQLVAMAGAPAAATGGLAVPPSLRALLLTRVDSLEPAERSVLELAAVLGESFHATDVAALAGAGAGNGSEVETAIDALVAQDVLRRVDRAYTIAHPLLRTTVYENISKQRRAQLHERLAGLPVEGGGEQPDDVAGHHLERAFRYRLESSLDDEGLAELGARARSRLTAAGRRSFAYGDVATAVNLLTRALSATVDPDDTPPALALELGEAFREGGRLTEAHEMLQRSVAAAHAQQDETLAWRAQASLVRVLLQLQSDELDVIRELAGETLDRLTALDDAAGLSLAWWAQAWIAWLGCRAAETEEALARAIDCARRAGDMRAEAHSANLYLGAALFGPLPVSRAVERCLELRTRHHTSRRLVASANRALAVLRAMEGDFEEARALAALDRRVLDELGMRFLAAAATEAHGLIELLAGDPAAAERVLREGYDGLVAMGDRNALPTVGAMLGEALFQCERYEDALAVTIAAAGEAGDGDLQAQVQWRLPHAKALAARGRRKKAVETAEEACAIAAGTDFLNLRADAHAAAGEVWRRLGDDTAAAAALERASALYAQKGNVVSASRVDVMLSALAKRRPPTKPRGSS